MHKKHFAFCTGGHRKDTESPQQCRAMMITVADIQTVLNAFLAFLCVLAHFTLQTAMRGGETEVVGH